MMKRPLNVYQVLGMAGMVLLPVVGALVLPGGRTPRRYHLEVVDRSSSMDSACASAVGDVAVSYDEAAVAQRELLVELFGTGDKSSADEPLRVLFEAEQPNTKVMDGKTTAAAHKRDYLEKILRTCQSWGRARVSAIHLAVRRAVEQAAAQKQQGVTAEIHVVTDLEETGDRNVRAQIQRRSGSKISLSARPLDNSAANVFFCGYAATKGTASDGSTLTRARTSDHTARLIEVWSAMFSIPATVSFRPFCAPPPPGYTQAAHP